MPDPDPVLSESAGSGSSFNDPDSSLCIWFIEICPPMPPYPTFRYTHFHVLVLPIYRTGTPSALSTASISYSYHYLDCGSSTPLVPAWYVGLELPQQYRYVVCSGQVGQDLQLQNLNRELQCSLSTEVSQISKNFSALYREHPGLRNK